MNVLAVGCHPDDLEIGCGGTLAKYVRNGDKVFMCIVASGNVGHRVIPSEELAVIRREEAMASGGIIGAEVIMLGADDLFVRSEDTKLKKKVVDVIRYAKPDIIITQPFDDYMDDHEETAKLVFGASMAATVNKYVTDHEFFPELTPIYFMEPLWGVDSLPDEYVDISDQIDTKLRMLSCHQSQIKWLKDHDQIDVLENTRIMSRFRGIQCGIGYAEGFTHMKKSHRLLSKRLLP